MNNQKLAKIFQTFAEIHDLRGEKNDFFRSRAYNQASLTLQNLSKDISEYVDLDGHKFIEEIPGFGEAMKHKVIEFLETGEIHEFEEMKSTVPAGLLDMLELKNVGPKKVKKFYYELNITSIEELKSAIESGEIAQLEGMGKKSAEKILESIEKFSQYSKRSRLGDIYFDLIEIEKNMQKCPYVIQAKIAGSARRMQETIGDVDILATGKEKDHQKIIEYFKNLPFIEQIEAEGPTKVTAFLDTGIQIDLRVVNESEFGAALQYFSGNKEHNVKLRTLAKQKGYKISEYGIFAIKSNRKVGGTLEEDIYKKLGLQFIPVELRQGNNEIDIAKQNKIPNLIKLTDIRGDLHSHSTYSDGTHSIKEMALKAISLKYDYLAITDHSPSLGVANGLSPERLKQKKKEIEKLKAELNFNILFGTEVDILQDGTLDYEDKILAEFDVVIASVHSKLDSNITERLISAMQNKNVHIIGHPTTRLINKREPSQIDFKKLFTTAKSTGTILEINSQPSRLDLPDIHVREACENYGIKFSIDTDAHNTNGLDLMTLGIGVARRGWLKKEDVINTLNFKDLSKALHKK